MTDRNIEPEHIADLEATERSPMKAEDIARVCHEANRALQITQADPAVSPSWAEAPNWQTESAVEGVEKVLAGATPEQLHQSWCEFKLNDGWVYGEVKDADATPPTHPCLVEYAELPADQRLKDDLFRAIVFTLARMTL